MKKRLKKWDRKQARAWMVLNEIKVKDIQSALGMKYFTQVSETINGSRNDRAVLQYLLNVGCPAQYLNLPSDMQKAA